MRLVAIVTTLLLLAGSALAGSGGGAGFDGGVTPDGNGLIVEPTTRYLGSTSPGVPLADNFKLTNTEMILSITVNGTYRPGTQCAAFTLTPPSSFPILMAPQQMDTWTVTFSASGPGNYYCHVEIQDTDANTDFIDLSAQVAAPMMSTSPTNLPFGSVLVGDTAIQSFYIANNGTGPLTINSLVQSGDPEFTLMGAPTPPFTVSPFGGTQMITVVYQPTANGLDMGQVTINGNDPNNPQDIVTFSGNGNATSVGAYLHLSPDPVAFGDITVGSSDTRDVSFSATGTGSVHVTRFDIVGPGASAYTIESHGCSGAQTCGVAFDVDVVGSDAIPATIQCAPGSVGLKAASFVVTSNASNTPTSVSLTCNGAGSDISVTPTSLDFGTVRLGQSSILPIQINNNGNATLNYSFSFSGDDDYSAAPACTSNCTLAPGIATTVMIEFAPSAIGPRNATLTISSDDPLEPTSTVNLSGIGGGGVLTIVQPASGEVAFGMIPQGVQSAPQMIQVRNDGNSNLKISGVALSSTTAFDLSGTLPPPDIFLAPSQTYTINVTCEPPDTTDYVASVTYASDAPVNGVQAVDLSCTGIDTDLVATPAPITFAPTRVGDTDTIHVEIENVGAAQTIEDMVASPGVFTILNNDDPPFSIGHDATTELDVRFTPTADGDVPGTLTVTGSSGDPLVVTLLGPGRVAAFTVSPPGYDFGAVCVGTQQVKRFSVMSVGSGDFEIAEPALIDPDVAFDLAMIDPDESDFPATIAPAGTVTVDITAAPTAGTSSGTLKFDTDIDPDGDVDVDLHIVAITSGVGIGPAAVDFGPIHVDSVSTPQEVSLANCNATPLAVSAVSITGTDADAFAVGGTLPPPDLIVPAQGYLRWTVVFRPTREGTHSAMLAITTDAGTQTVPLYGNGSVDAPDAGVGGPDAEPDNGFDTTSYYACTCRGSGGAGGAMPVVLVVALALRRRRRR